MTAETGMVMNAIPILGAAGPMGPIWLEQTRRKAMKADLISRLAQADRNGTKDDTPEQLAQVWSDIWNIWLAEEGANAGDLGIPVPADSKHILPLTASALIYIHPRIAEDPDRVYETIQDVPTNAFMGKNQENCAGWRQLVCVRRRYEPDAVGKARAAYAADYSPASMLEIFVSHAASALTQRPALMPQGMRGVFTLNGGNYTVYRDRHVLFCQKGANFKPQEEVGIWLSKSVASRPSGR
jgi:hypothetical protein